MVLKKRELFLEKRQPKFIPIKDEIMNAPISEIL